MKLQRWIGLLVAVVVSAAAGAAAARAWPVYRSVDPLTDRRIVRTVVLASNQGAGLHVRCRDGQLNTFIVVAGYIGEDGSDLRWRIDSGPVEEEYWEASDGGDGIFAYDGAGFARGLIAGSRLVVEFENWRGQASQFVFSLAGSGAAIRQVFAACGIPEADPRMLDKAIWRRVVEDLDKRDIASIESIQLFLQTLDVPGVPSTGRRDVATYRAASDFYATYWARCENGETMTNACSRWQREGFNPDKIPMEFTELLLEVLESVGNKKADYHRARPAGVRPLVLQPSASELAEIRRADLYIARTAGSATLECLVAASGEIERCRVVSDTDPDQGFGWAAMRAWTKYRFAPDPEGLRRRETLPVDFAAP